MDLIKIGWALFAGAVQFARALQGKVSHEQVRLEALEFIQDNAQAQADAEARERDMFDPGDPTPTPATIPG